MASSKFFYLDSLPINSAGVIEKLSLADELLYKSQFNLAVNSIQVEGRFAQLQQGIQQLLSKGSSNQVTVNDLNLILESSMCNLIAASSILSIDQQSQSSHYQRREQVVQNSFLFIDPDYLDSLLFSSNKVWGGSYGSLGYFLYLNQSQASYLHPSQIIYQSINQLNVLSQGTVFESNLNKIKELSLSDAVFDDVNLYQTQLEIFSASHEISQSISLIKFLESWLPQVLSWYLQSYRLGNSAVSSTGLNGAELAAFNVLIEVAKVCLHYGLDDSSFGDLLGRFIHQGIDPIFFSLTDDLINLREQTNFIPSSSNPGPLESLLLPFINSLGVTLKEGLLRKASYQLLQDLCAPGGYNLLLITVAGSLLNRAFILSHLSNTSYSDLSVFPMGFANPAALEFVGRVLRLVFLAGYTLSKSNLDSISLIGTNLITLSNLGDSSLVIDIGQ